MPLKLTRHILPLLMTTAYAITGHAQTDSMHISLQQLFDLGTENSLQLSADRLKSSRNAYNIHQHTDADICNNIRQDTRLDGIVEDLPVYSHRAVPACPVHMGTVPFAQAIRKPETVIAVESHTGIFLYDTDNVFQYFD